jgi:hypothetical protein
MPRRILPLGVLIVVAGCWPNDKPNQMIVQPGPLYPAPQLPAFKKSYAPAAESASLRVQEMTKRILAANPQIGMRPVVLTVGSTTDQEQVEIFHRGTGQIVITEGLVKLCTTDRFLAAVLCLEMGKMVSEREAIAGVRSREPEMDPPEELRIGNDAGGTFGPPDGVRMLDAARYDKSRRRPGSPPPPPPEPATLARIYLAKAGFHEGDLDDTQPIIRKAEANIQLERQMTANPPPMDQLRKQVQDQQNNVQKP